MPNNVLHPDVPIDIDGMTMDNETLTHLRSGFTAESESDRWARERLEQLPSGFQKHFTTLSGLGRELVEWLRAKANESEYIGRIFCKDCASTRKLSRNNDGKFGMDPGSKIKDPNGDFAQASPDRGRQWIALLSELYDSEADIVFQAAAAAGVDVSVLAKKFGAPLPPHRLHGAIQADSSQGGESLSALAADGTHLNKSASNDELGETPEDIISGMGWELSESQKRAKAGVVLLAIVLKSLRKYAPDLFSTFTEEMATRTKDRDFASAFIQAFAVVMKSRSVLLKESHQQIQPLPPVSPLDCVLDVMVKEGRAVTDEQKKRVRDLFVDRVAVYAYEYTRESPNFEVKRTLYDALDAIRGLDKFWKLAILKLSMLQMLVKACMLLVDELRVRINAQRSGTRVTRSDFSRLMSIVFPILEKHWPRPMLVIGFELAVRWLGENCALLQTLLPLVTTDLESSGPRKIIPPYHVATLFHLVWDDSVNGTIPGGWLYIAHTDSG
ncbi:hypothetical protein HK405_007184, partial [Cladochytrium tenue]